MITTDGDLLWVVAGIDVVSGIGVVSGISVFRECAEPAPGRSKFLSGRGAQVNPGRTAPKVWENQRTESTPATWYCRVKSSVGNQGAFP